MDTLPLQLELRPELPNVYGTFDYRTFRDTLIKIDEILTKSGLEYEIVSKALNRQVANNKIKQINSSKALNFHYHKLRHALRCNIARHLTGESYRAFSLRLTDSTLFQWFTHISAVSSCKATSKSALERYEKWFDEAFIANSIRQWLGDCSDESKAHEMGLIEPSNLKCALMDSTCIKANIHYPTDWVLLRDATRSLLLAIKTIRAKGLKHRMVEPDLLLKKMNKYCINMTHARRRKNSKKVRKAVLREMKKLTQCIRKHAQRYRKMLLLKWMDTTWSEAQMQQVIRRIDNILEQLPAAIQQAHDRIIGERTINSSDKLLSLYDRDTQVILRGKSGNEVEFGQRLLLTEQQDGVIIDWELFGDSSPSDSQLLRPVVERIESYYGKIDSISTDRAFSSEANDSFLKEKMIYNATCPKSPKQLQVKLAEPLFTILQTRRSQTEARIGIFKNVFLGRPLRSRITQYKRHAINWCVLTHNLWVLSRKAIADEQSLLKKAA